MKIPTSYLYATIYLSFAFDSLLKVNLYGLKIHVGIAASFFVLLFVTVVNLEVKLAKIFFKKYWSIAPFVVYLFFNIIFLNDYPGISLILTYYFVAIFMMYFAFVNERFISIRTITMFQWIMIATGLFQYTLYNLFDIQISFYAAEHYMLDASFATRLRGFFVEPNWYSISLSFNTILLFSQLGKDIAKYRWLLLFTALVMVFNASYLFVLVAASVLAVNHVTTLAKASKKQVFLLFITLVMVLATFTVRTLSKNSTQISTHTVSDYVNYGSRLGPATRTIAFMNTESIGVNLFGFGVGSWPYIGLENSLGYLGVYGEYKIRPAQRDSAEFHVFLLEVGYVGLFLFLFDYLYNYWKYRRFDVIYSVSMAYMLAAFFTYPVFKFTMYLLPFFIVRARALKGNRDGV